MISYCPGYVLCSNMFTFTRALHMMKGVGICIQ